MNYYYYCNSRIRIIIPIDDRNWAQTPSYMSAGLYRAKLHFTIPRQALIIYSRRLYSI
jgi:hypothetical protein